MKKVIFVVVLAAVLGVLAWLVYQRAGRKQGMEFQRERGPVPVEVAPVTTAELRDVLRLTGSIEAKSYFIVAPRISGRLKRLHVDIGDTVSQNQLIAELDDEEYRQQVKQAEAELAVAEASVKESQSGLEAAERDLKRVVEAGPAATAAERDPAQARRDAQEARLDAARAQVLQCRAAFAAARIRLSYTQIAASWPEYDPDGTPETRVPGRWVVGERFVMEGATLAANAPITSVFDLHNLTAVSFVVERDYPRLRLGQAASVMTDAFPDRVFAGRVRRIAPLLREASRQARAEIALPNAEGLLKPGMFVRIEIEIARREQVTAVPVRALVRRNGRQGVFVVSGAEGGAGKTARFVPLLLGIVDEERAEVVEPAISGQVVTLGQHLLENDSPVLLPGERPAGPATRPGVRSGRGGRPGPGGRP